MGTTLIDDTCIKQEKIDNETSKCPTHGSLTCLCSNQLEECLLFKPEDQLGTIAPKLEDINGDVFKDDGYEGDIKPEFSLNEEVNIKNEITEVAVRLQSSCNDKYLKCEMCECQFLKKTDLQRHMKVHTREKPIVCEVCHKEFSRRSHLTQHLTVHTEVKHFPCEVCGRKFSHQLYLAQHMIVHSREKPIVCEVCHKEFSSRSHLTQHLTVHTEVKHFPCEMCGRKFSQKSHLNQHSRYHSKQGHFIYGVRD